MVRPVVIVSGRRRSHEIFLLVASVVTGVAYTVGAPPPSSVASLLHGWMLYVWSVGLAVSGVLGLTALLLWRAWWSLQVEEASMLIGAGALIWYIVAVAQFGWVALFAASLSIGWAAANVATALEIRRDLRRAR